MEGKNAKTEINFINFLEKIADKINNITIERVNNNPTINQKKIETNINKWKANNKGTNYDWHFFIIIDLDKKNQQNSNKNAIKVVKKIIKKSLKKEKYKIHLLCKEGKNIEDLLIYPLADCRGKNKKKELNEKIATKKHKTHEYEHKSDPDLFDKITKLLKTNDTKKILKEFKKKLKSSEYQCVFALLLEYYLKCNKK